MSCLEMPRGPVPDFLGKPERTANDAADMTPREPGAVPPDARNGARVKTQDVRPAGVYRPNDNRLTPNMRSPEYVQMSTAAAITLGVMGGYMHRTDCTHCLNLLLTYPEGCRANCAYCGLARHREAERDYADRNFIRVDWPAVPYDQVIDIVASGGDRGRFHRMCISMITHPRSDDDTRTVLRKWTERIKHVPVSILSNPTTMTRQDVQDLKDLGAEIFTVALDACNPEIFERTRGSGVQSPHSWEKYWEIIHAAADIFGPEKFGAHLIVGMGESDHDVLTQVQRIRDLGGHSHMFAFFPEQGSLMDHLPPVPRPQWRRVQLARYLIDYRDHGIERMIFDEAGNITDFGLPKSDLDAVIDAGIAFRTSGCPGKDAEDISACDRPYGDSPPRDIASFPFKLNKTDVRAVRRQLDAGMPSPKRQSADRQHSGADHERRSAP
jgi:biotin synthase